jgi:hypothetical protein
MPPLLPVPAQPKRKALSTTEAFMMLCLLQCPLNDEVE